MGMGSEVMRWSMRAEDGRGPQTALREAVLAHFGTTSVHDAVVAIHRGDILGSAVLTLTRPLFAVAAAGDQVATDLVRRLADEVTAMALSPMRRLIQDHYVRVRPGRAKSGKASGTAGSRLGGAGQAGGRMSGTGGLAAGHAARDDRRRKDAT